MRFHVLIGVLLCMPVLAWADNTLPAGEHIYVTGEGEIEVTPDMVTIFLELEEQDEELTIAKSKVDRHIAVIVALAESLEISFEDVQFSELLTEPEFDWDENDKYVFVAHVVSVNVTVILRDLSKLGALVDGLVEGGVSGISGMELDSSQVRELRERALLEAVKSARLKAERLAAELGARLGPVYSVSDVPIQEAWWGGLNSLTDGFSWRASHAPPSAASSLAPGKIKVYKSVRCAFRLVQ